MLCNAGGKNRLLVHHPLVQTWLSAGPQTETQRPLYERVTNTHTHTLRKRGGENSRQVGGSDNCSANWLPDKSCHQSLPPSRPTHIITFWISTSSNTIIFFFHLDPFWGYLFPPILKVLFSTYPHIFSIYITRYFWKRPREWWQDGSKSNVKARNQCVFQDTNILYVTGQ